jgi:cobalt-zinc-cadmium efflux system membrane fusion protein
MNTISKIVYFAALGAGAIAWSGCRDGQAASAENPIKEAAATDNKLAFDQRDPVLKSVAVQPAEAAKGAALHLNGKVVWDDNVTVRIFSPFSGRVMKILVEAGQHVEENQPLALIASPDYGQAQADCRKASVDFAQAEKNLQRVKDLAEHGAAPEKDLHTAEWDYSRAQSELQRCSARLALYGGNTNTVDQAYCLRSPLAGIVIEKNINPGQEVRPDQMLASAPQLFAPLFLVSDPSKLWVQMDATEKMLGLIQPGQQALIHSPAYPGETFKGVVDFVSDSLDPQTRTVKIRAKVSNPNRALKGEMLVTVDLAQPAGKGVQIPASAVFLDGEAHYVFVEQGRGEFSKRRVTVGLQDSTDAVVLDGLARGERVVTAGTLFLDHFMAQKGS